MDLETVDLPGQEIFSSGKWNGDTFTDEDMESMANAFSETSATWGVPIKLSHEHPSHLPTVGWVENVRRVGSKLLADFKRVPKKIFELIQAGGYRGKSAEVFFNIDVNGKKYPKLLKAVALLGIDPKAVQSINDLISLYATAGGSVAKEYDGNGDHKSYDLGNQKEEDGIMEELKTKLAEAEKNFAQASEKSQALEVEIGALKAGLDSMTKRAEGAEAKVAEFAEAAVAQGIQNHVEKLILDGKLAPAKKEFAITLLKGLKSTGEKKYKLADKEYSLEDVANELLSGGNVNLPTEESTEVGERQAADLNEKAQQYHAKHPEVSFKDALRAVAPSK
jgi:hypothetical protein